MPGRASRKSSALLLFRPHAPDVIDSTEVQPAFYHTYQYVRGQKLGIIKCNQAILERLEVDPMAAVLHPRQLPMVIPPRMWQDRRTGCYILLRADVMRIKHAPEQRAQLERADLQGDLVDVYAALDYLGSTPWQINRRVYDIVAEVWNSGEAIADLPMKSPLLNMPDPIAPVGVNDDLAVKVRYQKAKRAVARNRGSQHSQRCAINYKLEIARAVRSSLVVVAG
jgi:DNA-directed RNA polymerase